MKKTVLFLSILFLAGFYLFSQEQLSIIGQTPGGAAHHVNWIEDQQKLIVGCGASLWVYDMNDLGNPQVIAKRAFINLIHETYLLGDVLFAAAEHEGLYALDFTCDSLSILDNYIPLANMTWGAEHTVSDFTVSNDTIFIPTQNRVHITFWNASENEIQLISANNNFAIPRLGGYCIAVNDMYIVVGKRKPFPVSSEHGEIFLFDRQSYALIDTYTDTIINRLYKVRFADLNDRVLYVCGGSDNGGFTSHFLAIHINNNDELELSDKFSTAGVPIVAAANIKNMDSRNDTLFLATTCWVDMENMQPNEPFSFIPVLDATGLPDEPLDYISYFYGGL